MISRHESVLSSHLDLLNSVKVHVGDGDAVRIVSSMVEKTNRLVMQFNVVKKQMVRLLLFGDALTSLFTDFS